MLIAESKHKNYDGFGFVFNLSGIASTILGTATGFLTGGGNVASAIGGGIGSILTEHQNKPLTGMVGGAIGGVAGQLATGLLPAGTTTSALTNPLLSGFNGLTGAIENLLKPSTNPTINNAVVNNSSGVTQTFTGSDGKTHNISVVQAFTNAGYSEMIAEKMDTWTTYYQSQGYSQSQAMQMAMAGINIDSTATNPPAASQVLQALQTQTPTQNITLPSPLIPQTPSPSTTQQPSGNILSYLAQLVSAGTITAAQAAQAQQAQQQYLQNGMNAAQAQQLALQQIGINAGQTILGMPKTTFYIVAAGGIVVILAIMLKKPSSPSYSPPAYYPQQQPAYYPQQQPAYYPQQQPAYYPQQPQQQPKK